MAARVHAHSLWESFSSLFAPLLWVWGKGKESHEMTPDMTDHGAAPLELSDINTFLPGCGQVRQRAGGEFAMISPGCSQPGICSDGWSYWHGPAAPVNPRKCRRVENAVTLVTDLLVRTKSLSLCPVKSVASCSTCWRILMNKEQHLGLFEVSLCVLFLSGSIHRQRSRCCLTYITEHKCGSFFRRRRRNLLQNIDSWGQQIHKSISSILKKTNKK